MGFERGVWLIEEDEGLRSSGNLCVFSVWGLGLAKGFNFWVASFAVLEAEASLED